MALGRGDRILKPDPAFHQRRASSRDTSVWVAASAGTGKTKVLTDRVLSLLLSGSRPERILCLTFTKAAAAEMAIRVNDRLSDWATVNGARLRSALKQLTGEDPDPDTIDRARRLFARVLDAPGGLRIDTIHAFCQSLLRRFPIEANVPPHFQVMEERSASEAMEQARSQVLARARAGSDAGLKSALALVTQLVPEQGFADLMDHLASQRARLASLLALGPAGMESKLRAALGLKPGETAASILEAACRDQAFDGPSLKRAAAMMLASQSKDDKEHGAWLAEWLEHRARRAQGFDEYCQVFFTQKGTKRQRFMTKSLADASPDLALAMEAEFARLERVRAEHGAALMADATAALLRLGGAVLASYESFKSSRALLDFDDLVLKSSFLLERPGVAPWVLYKLDGGIDHILIDEAQDTNPEQWRVVAALAGDFFSGQGAREQIRTVFAVGDVKQSIFSFQRADPAAFQSMRRHFEERVKAAQAKWDVVELETSFRSTPAILQTVDAVFASGLASDGVSLDGADIRHEAFRSGAAGLVELWPPVGPEEGDAPEPWDAPLSQSQSSLPAARLALAVAAKIEALTHEKLEAKNRRITPGDVMVLVRRRTPFIGALVRALKERGVDVAGVDRMHLADQLAIEDMVALANFLLLPEDDLNLACVLKGPLYGFNEEALFELAWRRKGSLWNELRRRSGDRPEFRHASLDLSDLLAKADFIPPYELFAEVLGARGGRRKMLKRLGPEAADPLDELLAAALAYERGHGVSLQGFLHWLVLGELEVKRDLNNDSGRDEVRVITVHGAKGLQAPVVFLPDTLQLPRASPPLVWSAQGLPLWLRQGDAPAARAALEESNLKRDQEYRRLLYVALTRAEDRLYVCGWHGRQAPPEGNWYQFIKDGLKKEDAQVFKFDAGKLIGKDGWAGEGLRLISRQRGKTEESAKPARPARAGKSELPAWTKKHPKPEPSPPRPLAPSRPSAEEPAAISPLSAEKGANFQRGLLVHRLLQSLPGLAPDKREAAARRFLALPVFALPREQQDSIRAETLAVLSHPGFAHVFSPQSAAEVPVVGLIKGRAISGRIDRLVVTGNEVLIVDYKTLRPVPKDESQVPAAYLAQLAAYRAAVSAVYPGKTVRCALLWTEGPALLPIGDFSLARFA
jgi:ATP-dependent helicase/nuclease subunit A